MAASSSIGSVLPVYIEFMPALSVASPRIPLIPITAIRTTQTPSASMILNRIVLAYLFIHPLPIE